jgi:hypothetical protein
MTYGGSPLPAQMPPEMRDKIIHVRMLVGDQVLMGGDAPPQNFQPAQGFNVSIKKSRPRPNESSMNFPPAARSPCRCRRPSGRFASAWPLIVLARPGSSTAPKQPDDRHLLESTNLFPSTSLKMADVPQLSFFGSFSNSTPLDFIVFAVAKTSSHQNDSG